MIAAGLDGINRQLHPGPAHNENLYDLSQAELRERGISVLPQNLDRAVDALEADALILDALGPVGCEFIRLKRMEWIEYMRHVSDWEIKSYLEFF